MFSSKLGFYTGGKVTIHLKSDATSHFLKASSVPFSLKPKVLDKLDRLEQEGVIRQVDYSEWAMPIVPVLESSGQVRICSDFKMTFNMEIGTVRFLSFTSDRGTFYNVGWRSPLQ